MGILLQKAGGRAPGGCIIVRAQESACSCAGAVGADTPLSFPTALAARARPRDALLMLRAGAGASDIPSSSPFEDELPSTLAASTAGLGAGTPVSTPTGLLGMSGQPCPLTSCLVSTWIEAGMLECLHSLLHVNVWLAIALQALFMAAAGQDHMLEQRLTLWSSDAAFALRGEQWSCDVSRDACLPEFHFLEGRLVLYWQRQCPLNVGRGRATKLPQQAAAGGSRQSEPDRAAEAARRRARRLRRLKLEIKVKLQAGVMQDALASVHAALSGCLPDDKGRYASQMQIFPAMTHSRNPMSWLDQELKQITFCEAENGSWKLLQQIAETGASMLDARRILDSAALASLKLFFLRPK